MRIRRLLVAALLLTGPTLWASEYLTEGGDAARSGWMKNEKVFTPANVKDSKLLWSIKLDSTPREMHNLFAPLIAENVATPQGPKEIGLVAGVSDDLFALDVAAGRLLWKKHFDFPNAPVGGRGGGTLCPGGQTAVPALVPAGPGKYTIVAVSWDGRLHQVNLADGEDVAPPEKFLPANGKPYALNVVNGVVYTASAQGCGGVPNAFYAYDMATRKASIFTPAGGGLWGRRGAVVTPEGTIFLGTGDGQYDPVNRSLGNALVGVKIDANKQLQLVDYFSPPDANWMWRRDLDVNTTPLAIDYHDRKFLVGTSKECKVWLLDRDEMGGEDHRTALFTTPLICNDAQAFDGRGVWGAMANWQDRAGTEWVLVPFWGPVSTKFHAPVEVARPAHGGVAAFKLEEQSGKWQLTPAWLSGDMNLAEEVVVANGIVFTYGAGEDATQVVGDLAWDEPGGPRYGGGLNSSSQRRIPGSGHATMYALDAMTGKTLWSSGDQITSWNHFSGITVANGRAYLGTFDGTMWCFGVAGLPSAGR